MTLEHITDHVDRAAENMISQYHDKPRINAVLASYAQGCQDAEDMMWDVLTSRLLDNATGGRLDTIGKIVGQSRKGSTDDQYRLYIQARILVNRSLGKVADIDKLMQLLLADYEHRYRPEFPATVMVEAYGLDLTTHDADVLAELFGAAVGGGIAFEFRWCEEGDEDSMFTFSDTDTLIAGDDDKGFGGYVAATGGHFSAVRTA